MAVNLIVICLELVSNDLQDGAVWQERFDLPCFPLLETTKEEKKKTQMDVQNSTSIATPANKEQLEDNVTCLKQT